jgi:hypothetical protein
METATFTSAWRAAVALNNMGLTLLGRSCHRDATSALKDALDLMGSLRIESYQRGRLSSADQSALLDKASKSVARSTQKDDPMATASSFDLSILSPSSTASDITAAIHKLPCRQSGYAFLLEFDDLDPHGNINSSIALLNLSVASRISSQQSKKRKRRTQLVARAFQCAYIANRLLSDDLDVLDDDIHFERAVLVSMFILHELFLLSSEMGEEDESREYYSELCDRRQLWIEAEEANLPVTCHQLAASAA